VIGAESQARALAAVLLPGARLAVYRHAEGWRVTTQWHRGPECLAYRSYATAPTEAEAWVRAATDLSSEATRLQSRLDAALRGAL
jgi:hypothetical protein